MKLGRDVPLRPTHSEVPLPGFYPCLTLQLNVTRYTSGGVGRMVLVVRDPAGDHEVHRSHLETTKWETVAIAAANELFEALGVMIWMQDGDNPQ